jgi:hypothetical protein
MILVARVWPAPRFRLLAPHSHSAIYLGRNPGAGDGNRTRMTSLEDRYRAIRSDVQMRTRWSRRSNDPLLTVSTLGSSRHLAHAWPKLNLGYSDTGSSAPEGVSPPGMTKNGLVINS